MAKNIADLFRVLGNRKKYYLVASLLLIASIFFRALEPKILQVTVDHVLVHFQQAEDVTPKESDVFTDKIISYLPAVERPMLGKILLILGLMFLVISVIRGAFMLTAQGLTAFHTEKSVKLLRDRLFGHIQSLPLNYFGKTATGELVQKTTGDVETVRKFIMEQVVEVVRLSAIFGFAFYMMFIVSWQLALICIASVPLVFISSLYFFKKEGKLWEKHEEEADKLNSIVQENLNGIRVVKAFAQEAYEKERFDKQNLVKRAIGMKHVDLHCYFWTLTDMLILLQITASIMAGGYFVMTNALSIGQLISFYTYMLMVSWPMRQAGRIVSQMGMATVAIGRINEILSAKPEDYEGDFDKPKLSGKIRFENVWFKYKDEQDWILKDVSFEITPGENVAFVGPAGSGKSTIIKLLNRFYEPTKGSIYLDDKALEEYDKTELRSRMGLVLQKPFLFSTTIKDNIAYTRQDFEDAEIEAAATMADAQKLHEILIHGFDTQVGEKGVSLSGGQKQRVALARTIMSQPDLLILDDVTSAVDTDTELAIFEKLAGFIEAKTTIIISHRLTSIQLANRIIVFENGRITEDGAHEVLIKNKGYYNKINELQIGLEEEIQAELNLNH